MVKMSFQIAFCDSYLQTKEIKLTYQILTSVFCILPIINNTITCFALILQGSLATAKEEVVSPSRQKRTFLLA